VPIAELRLSDSLDDRTSCPKENLSLSAASATLLIAIAEKKEI
jgi:hypothetical protein